MSLTARERVQYVALALGGGRMLLNFRTEVGLGSDKPAAATRTFIDLLRRGAIDTEGARVELQLVATPREAWRLLPISNRSAPRAPRSMMH